MRLKKEMNDWYKKNNLDDCKNFEYLKLWMNFYNIKKYDLTVGDGYTSLRIICRNNISYVAIPEPNYCRLRIVSLNRAGRTKNKGYHVVRYFGENGYVYGDNCWVRFFKEIVDKFGLM